MVPRIVEMNAFHSHAINRGGLRYMEFQEVSDADGRDVKYRINAWTSG